VGLTNRNNYTKSGELLYMPSSWIPKHNTPKYFPKTYVRIYDT